jgi:deoxyribodipyrimidine photolyase-related protein
MKHTIASTTLPHRTIRLILGDQLNPQHRWFSEVDDATTYVFMEVRQETDYVLHHAQKILAIFAAMRDLPAVARRGTSSALHRD